MTINRNNLSSSAYGADILNIGAADSPFTNLGNLTTSGMASSPIRVSASGVSVSNKGSLSTSGDGSPGITVGDVFGTHYDNVTVTNYGSINTSGNFLDDGVSVAFPDGIDTYGNNERLINYGTINATSADAAGMASIGINCQLTNYGSINAGGAGLIADTVDGTGQENGNLLINYGHIHTSADGSLGIICYTSDNVVKNYGTVQADGVFSYGIALEGSGNHAENYGSILVTGDLSRGALLKGEQQSFVNYGSIQTTGADSIGARFSGENPAGSDGGTYTNFGKITSAAWAVLGALSNDHFINHGSLVGNVDMGAGDDTYVAGKGGSLTGVLTLGDGNDLIVFEKGGGKLVVTDFVAGAGTDDVIDLSGVGFHTFGDVMSHATQLGSDVVLNLGAHDQIVLQNVALGMLSPDDFTLAAAALPHDHLLAFV